MDDTTMAETRAIGEAYFDAFNDRNLDAFDDLLTDDFVSHLRVGDVAGIPAFRAMMEQVFDAFPDVEWGLEEMICTSDRVIYRYYFQGTHRGSFLGIAASQRFVRIEGAEVLHIEDGRITEIWNYTDLMGLASRLNAINPLALEI